MRSYIQDSHVHELVDVVGPNHQGLVDQDAGPVRMQVSLHAVQFLHLLAHVIERSSSHFVAVRVDMPCDHVRGAHLQ